MNFLKKYFLTTDFFGPFSIYEQPKYKPNLTLILTLIQILTLKPTWVDATIRSHFGCSYIEKEPIFWPLINLIRIYFVGWKICKFITHIDLKFSQF